MPVILPELDDGAAPVPLSQIKDFVELGNGITRETDTFDTFMDSQRGNHIQDILHQLQLILQLIVLKEHSSSSQLELLALYKQSHQRILDVLNLYLFQNIH